LDTEKSSQLAEYKAVWAATTQSFGMVQMTFDGIITAANEKFLEIFGYREKQVVGFHHRMLCDHTYAQSHEYRKFWAQLGEGLTMANRFKREHRNGGTLWLQAVYTPIFDADGKPARVLKIATDITRQTELELELDDRLRDSERLRKELVEASNIKEATISDIGTSHLSYLGDAEIGANANIGAGTITCNYDGYFKYKTVIGERAFIGSNSSLIAPVTIGADAIVGAGSAVSRDVGAGDLRVVRGEQSVKPGWADRFHDAMKKKKAAEKKD